MQNGPVNVVPLTMAPPGAKLTLVGVSAGRGLAGRLMALGLVPGQQIEVLSNVRGPLMVRVKGSKIALARGMAQKVMVHRTW